MERQVWIHQPSGCLCAVSFKDYLRPVAEASNELAQSEVEAAILDGFDSSPEQVEWVNAHSDEFELHSYLHEGQVVRA